MAITRLDDERFDRPPADPWQWVRDWIEQASQADLVEYTAMNLASVDDQGRPSNRTVLFKGWKGDEICFFTNLQGRKGRELLENPAAALCFWWDRLDRQIRFEGEAIPLSESENDAYFSSRDRGSQLGAWASNQSRPIESRAALEQQFSTVQTQFPEPQAVPRPPHWGGFSLKARHVEIWQGQPNRFHDRICYSAVDAEHWKIERLQP